MIIIKTLDKGNQEFWILDKSKDGVSEIISTAIKGPMDSTEFLHNLRSLEETDIKFTEEYKF